jgi:SAM-dependent methyltransferase
MVDEKPTAKRGHHFRSYDAIVSLNRRKWKVERESHIMISKPAVSNEPSTYLKFGEYYDLIYGDRDYRKDVDLVLNLIGEFAGQGSRRILELGCGSGAHSVLLAQQGHEIVGVDQSSVMLAAARRKAARQGPLKLEFRLMDVRALAFPHQFDACVSMFGCMSYLVTRADLRKALVGVEQSLLPQGIFIFDFWNERAVKAQKPSVRRKNIVLGTQSSLIRVATPEVDWQAKVCSVCYHVSLLENENVKESFEETHRVRFFDPQEIIDELEGTGFEVLDIRTPDGDKCGTEKSWFLVAIARRAGESGRP